MKQISEHDSIREFLMLTETKVTIGEYQGVVAEVEVNDEFDGTIVYFPGVTLLKLKGGL